ncbi:MAG: hypothetical protein ABIS38_07985 [Sphingomicrobium sp.]
MMDESISRIDRHRDGSVSAKGEMLNDKLHGYWEWYRTDGTLKRSGHFHRGEQVGEWITHDQQGSPFKISQMKPTTNA